MSVQSRQGLIHSPPVTPITHELCISRIGPTHEPFWAVIGFTHELLKREMFTYKESEAARSFDIYSGCNVADTRLQPDHNRT
ncbi:hypothetical protein HNR39_003218 [Glaciimonas immobilis]|uniref:Uncharacterized protein n=1 Tax=Glaciimonas immobilis TaxID=728004 RepID=A0A840RU56_9BURK|nr:hypothetical protein [Glaciimonas immobilis]